MPAISTVTRSGIPYVDYVDGGTKWAVNSFTYSFPTSASFYVGMSGTAYGSGEQNNGFKAFTPIQQAATASILNMYSAVANVTFTQITETSTQSADLRYAESNAPSTAWGYYPSTSPEGGDAWFNNSSGWYNNPVVGNYAWLTIIHETGHLLGLKHTQDTMGSFGPMPANIDSLEYSVMSYRSYTGASVTQGLTNATWSFPTTLMMDDIAALQYMYGANYSTNNTNTVYKWNPATGQETINGVAQAAPGGNTIFMTLWDGGGNDTYDFSNYTTNVSANLQPGSWTTTSAAQLANLGNSHIAIGNIANAYLNNNNPASLIENAVGGSGGDTLVGNAANNTLTGGAGNDTLDGVSGTADTAVYSGPSSAYQVSQNADGSWRVADLRTGSPDGTDTLKNIEFLQFSDKTIAIGTVTPPPVVQAPSISSFSPDSASIGDGITNANILTLAGTAQANATVKVYDGTLLLGSVIANVNGNWTLPTGTLTDGTHSFTATAIDASGNTSVPSTLLSVIVDTVAPVAPTVSLQSVDSGTAGDHITNVNVISLTGVAEINSTIKVYDGATLLGSATANAEGVWNFVADLTDDQIAAPAGSGQVVASNSTADATAANQHQAWGFTTGPMPDGVHNFTVTSTDAAGNISGASTALKVTIDTVAPNAPTITTNTMLNTNAVSVTGTAEAGSTVNLLDGTVVVGTGTANSSGGFNITTNALSSGSHVLTAKATDIAGNTSLSSQAVSPVIGATVIESTGSTSLTKIGNNFYLFNSAGSGPELQKYGVNVVAGQFGALTPIGAEQTASGYEVAWKNGTANLYIVWNTNGSGNWVSEGTYTSSTLQSLEPSFHQDLNGDGVIGVPTTVTTTPTTPTTPTIPTTPTPPTPSQTVIESFGSTELTAIGNNFYLFNSAGSGPELQKGEVNVVAGQFGAWTPIGAEQTATGYEVAWKSGSADQYIVWNTNNSGNWVSETGTVAGSSSTLQSLEPSFHQDLNGDGVIGVPTSVTTTPTTPTTPTIPTTPTPPTPSQTVIESFGSTDLTAIGNNFYLFNSVGSGPELQKGGVNVVAGQSGAWTPIGAEQTATGYEVAWKNGAANLYIVWNTNSSGNWVSESAYFSAFSSTLQSLEPSFHQDLNGDGTIGVPGSPMSAKIVSGTSGNDTLTSTVANQIFFGNGGNNTFVFSGAIGKDTVADFQTAHDVVQLSHNVFATFADVMAHTAQVGPDVTVTFDATNSVTLQHTLLSHLTSNNFHLV